MIKIHEQVSGTAPGRRHALEVLNKSAIVLLVACWESFVEELAQKAFETMVNQAAAHSAFPKRVLALAVRDLREAKDEASVWKLAGDGWKRVLRDHSAAVLKRHIGPFHAPGSENVASLFKGLIGLADIRTSWRWTGMNRERAVSKLDALLTLRQEIAHKVKAHEAVRKQAVIAFADFIHRLAGVTSNGVSTYIQTRTGAYPWSFARWGGEPA